MLPQQLNVGNAGVKTSAGRNVNWYADLANFWLFFEGDEVLPSFRYATNSVKIGFYDVESI